jgi:hypothetical protein
MRQTDIAFKVSFDGIDDFEDGNMDNGHRPGRATRPKLFAEHAGLTLSDRGMVDAAGIDGRLIPVTDDAGPIEPVPGTMFQIRWGLPGIRMEPRAERVIESAAQSLRQKTLWKCQREQHREESQELAGLRPHRIPPLSHLRRTFL